MKLSGSHMMLPFSVPLSWVVVACLTSSEAFKVHGESSDVVKMSVMDMEGASNVAQIAYQQQLISKNTWKAFSNVSSFLEAAHSAGLDWTHSDAQKHLVLTAHGLKKSLKHNEVSLLSTNSTAGGPRLGAALSSAKTSAYDALGEDGVDDLQGEFVTATLGLLSNWATTGEPPSVQSIVTVVADMAIMAIGMYNPLLGAVAGMAYSMISALMWPEKEQDDPMAKLYKKVMEQMGIAISQGQMQVEVRNAEAELGAVLDELQWMPTLLGGSDPSGPSDDQIKILLTYNIMMQHDIAKIAYKIQTSAFGNAKAEGATEQWAAAMFPIAGELITLQTNLIYEIASHDLVDNTNVAAARILDLLTDWKKWIDANLGKAHEGNKKATEHALGWKDAKTNVKSHHTYVTYERLSSKKTCTVSGINACSTMKCGAFDKWYNCGKAPDGWCGDMCTKWTAYDFYWRYLAPKVGKIQLDVENMITSLGPTAGFEKIFWNFCNSGFYEGSEAETASLDACAASCRQEMKCKYFVFKANHACQRFDTRSDGTGSCPGGSIVSPNHRDIYMKKEVASSAFGRCSSSGLFYKSATWELLKGNQGKTKKDLRTTVEGHGWVAEAWKRCLEKDAATTHVSVWAYARFFCYKTLNCKHITDEGYTAEVRTWDKAALSPYRSLGTGMCTTTAFADSGEWALVKKNQGNVTRDYLTTEYHGWVAAAWASCIKKNGATSHVSVFKTARFRCYISESCPMSSHKSMQTWTYERMAPIPMDLVGRGHCKLGQFYDSRGWALTTPWGGKKLWTEDENKAWVQQAWTKCLAENPNTTFVSVWKDAGFRCYDGAVCEITGDQDAHTFTRARSSVFLPPGR